MSFLWVKHGHRGVKLRSKAWVGATDEVVTESVPLLRPWDCTRFLGKKLGNGSLKMRRG